MSDANVFLWGRRIGAVSWVAECSIGVFQYDPEFVGAGIEISPILLPVREEPYSFPALMQRHLKGCLEWFVIRYPILLAIRLSMYG